MSNPSSFDIIISGAGLVGGSTALGLADLGFQVALIEPNVAKASTEPDHDRRTLVLNGASLNVLSHLSVITPQLRRVPVRHIRINRQGGFGHLDLHAEDHPAMMTQCLDGEAPYFGQVVVAAELGQAIQDRLSDHPNITLFCPEALARFEQDDRGVRVHLNIGTELTSEVLVGADGNASLIRQALGVAVDRYDYQQSAMVFNCQAAKPEAHTAFERFTPQGPLALLPQANGRYGVVWIDQHEAIDQAKSWPDDQLMARLAERFGSRLGLFSDPSPRASYPLIKQHTPTPVVGRVVLVGNAANAVHPVSAQGLNLGLRDVAGLIDHLKTVQSSQTSWPDALEAYQASRAYDQRATVRYTHTLAKTFAHPLKGFRFLAGLGLALHAATPKLQDRLVHQAMGFRQPVPSLAGKPVSPKKSASPS